MAKTIGELVAGLKLNTTSFKASIKNVNNDIKDFDAKVGALALGGTAALAGMTLAMSNFVNEAGKAEGLAGGFARNFGEDAAGNLQILRDASKGTVSDMQLMQSANQAALLGVSNDVNELGLAFTTARLRGKEMGLGSQEAFDSLVKGIGRGSPLILDNIGIFIPQALKDMRDSMTDSEYKAALLQEVLRDGSNIFDAYGEDVLTARDKIDRMKATFENLRVTLGTALIPVMGALLNTVAPIIRVFSALVNTNPKLVQTIVKLSFAVVTGVTVMAALNKAWIMGTKTLAMLRIAITTTQLSLGALGVVLIAVGALFAYLAGKQLAIKSSSFDAAQGFANMGDTANLAGDQVSDAMAKSAESIQKVKESIEEENQAFEDSLRDIVNSKLEQIDKNKAALEKEKKQFDESQADMTKSYEENMSSQEEANAQKLKDLEISLRKSLVVGSSTYDQDLANFNEMIEAEMAAGDRKLQEITDQFKKETAEAQAEYDERTSALQAKIDADEAMLEKHAEAISKINLDVQKDEIDILKETHAKRLAELDKQLASEKASRDGANADMVGGYGDAIDAMGGYDVEPLSMDLDWSQLWDDFVIGFNTFLEAADNGLRSFGASLVKNLKEIGSYLWDNLQDLSVNELIKGVKDLVAIEVNPGGKGGKSKGRFQAYGTSNFAGGVAMVGERGPEEVYLPPGTMINDAKTTQDNRSNTVTNVFNQVIDKSVDVDAFNRRQAFILSGIVG